MEENVELRRRAQTLRKNATKEENHLWYDFLKTYPVQFKRQYQIGVYYADFFCYRAGIVVELDGSQHYERRRAEYDSQRTAFLEKQGLLVLRFFNYEVWKHFPGVCETIDRAVKERVNEKEGF